MIVTWPSFILTRFVDIGKVNIVLSENVSTKQSIYWVERQISSGQMPFQITWIAIVFNVLFLNADSKRESVNGTVALNGCTDLNAFLLYAYKNITLLFFKSFWCC